ncbi:succinate dehydrogenase, cytochrome b556 subunit [Rickettsiales bacterium]|nr:succinate dehydrogenase, cytochrome b556 subunit [Rickettsiales bacterium]
MTKLNQTSVKRPLSPHLSIYKPQITSVLSISHRLTGVALYVGTVFLALWTILSVYGCASCINPLIKTPVGYGILGIWSLALYYHLCNGVRHLFWDAGKGYEISVVTRSGVLVVIASVAMTLLTWAFAAV